MDINNATYFLFRPHKKKNWDILLEYLFILISLIFFFSILYNFLLILYLTYSYFFNYKMVGTRDVIFTPHESNSTMNTKNNNNMSHENYDPSFPDQPVVHRYLSVWANLPAFRSKPAFIWVEDGSSHAALTYAQLDDSVQSISSRLLITLQRGDAVVVLCSPGLELVEIIFGCQRAGLLSVPVCPPDPFSGKESCHHLIRVLSQTKPKAAIAHRDYIANVQRYISSSFNDKKLAMMLQNLRWISTDDVKDKKVYIYIF